MWEHEDWLNLRTIPPFFVKIGRLLTNFIGGHSMKRAPAITTVLLIVTLAACAYEAAGQGNQAAAGWSTLFDGKSLSASNPIGDANWQLTDGVVQANKGNGYLV